MSSLFDEPVPEQRSGYLAEFLDGQRRVGGQVIVSEADRDNKGRTGVSSSHGRGSTSKAEGVHSRWLAEESVEEDDGR